MSDSEQPGPASEETPGAIERDWTCDSVGRSNSSPEFIAMADEVARLVRHNGGQALDVEWVSAMARLIVAQLAHKHGLAPQ